MILVLDNYDSFVHNLARYFEIAGMICRIVRNDAISVPAIAALKPEAIVISPGPCTPQDSGICIDAVRELGRDIPILGVCLGHQCIAEAYGGRTVRAAKPMHGQASAITHDETGIFEGVPNPLNVGRYHSLISVLPEDAPLQVTARTDEGVNMAMRHERHPVYGVQFHPESVLTDQGMALIENFIEIARAWNAQKRKAA